MLALIISTCLLYGLWLIPAKTFRFSQYFAYLAWILHGIICFNSLFDENGWKLHIANSVLLVSWLSVMIVFWYKLVSLWVKIPLVFFVWLSLIIIYFNISVYPVDYKMFSWQLDLHISLSMLAYSIFVVATLFAISLYTHIKRIKNKPFSVGSTLIPIVDEERKLFQLIFLGWLVLTTSLLSGVIFIDDFMQQHLGHKVVFSILAWLVFGAIVLARLTRGMRGEKLIITSIFGMFFLATGYLGSKIVLEWLL